MTENAAPADAPRTVLSRIQRGIESLYRVDTRLDVESFLVDEDVRRHTGVARAPREQLLISQAREGSGDTESCGAATNDEVRIGLFLDRDVVANLERHDPAHGLDDVNFGDFCLAIEGISHFIYVVLCAAADRSVSALELELQAEVDKFACCFLIAGGGDARRLSARLYEDITFASDLDVDERDRYRVANLEARRYTATLSRTFVARDRVSDMLSELRRFYRLGLDGKLGHIARVAA
ncbi:MAG: hypothetical protein H7X95_12190 [Deltaproteobacteria bacterium]|nr:hypothetical protein [Deltaproteobacteria bacterium]